MNRSSPYRVLFLCTGNSARSILAEYILRERGHGRFESFSAGADPAGRVNPFALEILRDRYAIPTDDARSKSWQEFAAQPFDFIITLCDKAQESCPTWPGGPVTAHWSSPDPAAVEGDTATKRRAFIDVATQIAARIGTFTSLRDDQLDTLRVRNIGREFNPPGDPAKEAP